jgi:hypothetical protein
MEHDYLFIVLRHYWKQSEFLYLVRILLFDADRICYEI